MDFYEYFDLPRPSEEGALLPPALQSRTHRCIIEHLRQMEAYDSMEGLATGVARRMGWVDSVVRDNDPPFWIAFLQLVAREVITIAEHDKAEVPECSHDDAPAWLWSFKNADPNTIIVVYLNETPEQLLQRLADDATRELLSE